MGCSCLQIFLVHSHYQKTHFIVSKIISSISNNKIQNQSIKLITSSNLTSFELSTLHPPAPSPCNSNTLSWYCSNVGLWPTLTYVTPASLNLRYRICSLRVSKALVDSSMRTNLGLDNNTLQMKHSILRCQGSEE